LDFFKPTSKSSRFDNSKITGASIHRETENRMKDIKERRKYRRQQINNRTHQNSTSSSEASKNTLNVFRKDKDLTRTELRRKENKDISRFGIFKKNTENLE
jgi:hypothetical protein